MELETLEVLLDINTERVMQSLEKVLPQIENAMSRIERMSGSTMDKTEKNMDIDKGVSNFTKQLDKMTQTLEKTMANFEKSTKQTSEAVGANLATGVRKARPKVTKEIDAMVNEINAKMGQAKAAQEKVAYLKSQRQSASSKGDTGQVVKYDEQIARAQAQMTKFQDQAKGMGNTIKRELDSVPSSLDNITKGMSRNEAKIESMRKRIRTLKAEYNDQRVPTGSFSSGFKNYEDTPQSLKTSQEIQKQSVKMDKLISDNDRLQKEYAQTEDRAEMLRKALLRVNNALGQSSIQTGSAVNGANMTGSGLKQSERAVSRYGGVFNRMSNAISHGAGNVGNGLKNSLGFIGKFGSLFSNTSNKVTRGTAQMTLGTSAFGQSMKYLLPSLIVYQLIGGAINKMASGMMSALKTNDEFASSLNQIKVNLLTAFYPIYTAILPAINSFMSAIAQLTGQLASFIAMIFGTTYEAAKQGASGLYDNVQALNETGSSANKAHEKVKKLQKSLMGFDEINNLTVSTDDDSLDSDKPKVDFGAATGSYDTPKWMKDIQNIFKDFFKPFQDAWRNQGQRVIDAWKYALGEIIGLASAIGRSFMEVWTNGTGQRFIENILILLADVLYIIGDIARAFREAWEENNRGTRLIQSIFNSLNAVLELLHEVAVAFRNAWNDNGLGRSIIGNILDILTNVFNIITNIADGLKDAWKQGNVGQSIFSTILTIVNDLLSAIERMTRKTAEWADKLNFAPLLVSIDNLLKSIEPLTKNVFDGLAWAWENVLLPLAGFVIENVLPAFLNLLGGALDFVNGVIEGSKPAFKWLWDNMLKPVAEWSGGVIVEVLNNLGDGLSKIGEWISKHSEGFSKFVTFFLVFFGAIKAIGAISSVISIITGIFGVLSSIGGLGGLLATVGSAIASVVAVLGGPITIAIAAVIALGVLLWQNWEVVSEKAVEIWGAISSYFGELPGKIGGYFSDFFNAGMDLINGLLMGFAEKMANVGKWVEENITGPIVSWVKKLFGIHSPSKVFSEIGKFLIEGLYQGIKDLMSKPVELISKIWTGMKSTVTGKTSEIFASSKKWWGDTKKTISDVATNTGKWVSDKWQGISRTTSNTWGNVSKWSSEKWNSAKKSVTDNAKSIWDNTKNRWSDIGKNTRKTWDDFTDKITDTARRAKDNASNRISELKTNIKNRFSDTWSNTRSVWDNIYSKIANQSNNSKNRGSSAFRNLRTEVNNSMNGMKNTVKSVFDNIGKWASDLPSRITTGLSNGVGAIKKAAGKIGDGLTGVLGGAVNGVISGIKWVLEKVGAKSAAADLGKFTVPKYPKYAQGTGYHPGGYAWVNDGSGSNYQEAFQTPDGRTGLFPRQRNMLVDLPRGTSVLNGSKTAQMMQGLPAYKNGVGKWISASSEWLKEKWNGAKDIASDIWSYAKDPSKLLTAAVSKYVDLSNVVDPTLTIAKGAVGKMIDGAKGWVTDKFNKGHEDYKASLQAESSASFGPGAYAPRFKNPPFIQTSDFGNRAALYGRTFHNGMDFAAPLGTALKAQYPGTVSWASSVPSYGNLVAVEVANGVRTLYGHMNSIAVKVGQSVKQNQILGTVGSTGDSTGPHVHYELKTGGTPPWGGTTRDPKTYGQKAINAVNDFKSVGGTSASAVARTIWNGLTRNNYSKQAAAGILGNVEAESSMNPDLDELYGPGYGIVQWTSPSRGETGRSYVQRLMKQAGIKGDYRSAEAQTKLLLWHMRNGQWIGQVDPRSVAAFKKTTSVPTATYAFLKNFERAGVEHLDRRYNSAYKYYNQLKGYENGGLVTQDGIYRMGEGNKKEMVIPLERPQRAAELIQQAIEYLGLDMFGSSITLPEMFQTPSFTPTNATFSNNEQMNYKGGGMQQSFEAMINGIMMAITSMGGQPQQAPNGDIIINIAGKEFGRIAVKEINKYHQQLGYTELNI